MTQSPATPRVALRTLLLGAGALAIVLVIIVAALNKKPPAIRSKSIGARLELAAGEVTITDGATSQKALSGAPLPSGAHVATGKGSRALVRAGDGSAVFLRGESEAVLGEKQLELVKGEMWLDAPKVEGDAAQVKAGPHTIAASDAGLSVKRNGDAVTVYVARGLATLTSPGGRIEVNAGEQGDAQASGAPKTSSVSFWQDWTGGMGDARPGHGAVGAGAGRIYGVDANARGGAPARKLGIAKQVVRAVLRDGLAETEVDQTFANPGSVTLEGWYWFTVPPQATVTSFALETDGVLIEGEIVEKREAAAKYEAAKRAARDPALLEWVDGRSYRARIFPIPAMGTRRVVLRYTEMLPLIDGKTRYVYPLRSDDPVRFDELALSVDLGPNAGDFQVAASLDATIEDGGRRVAMRRSGYVPRADFQLEMVAKTSGAPVHAWRFAAGTDQADYVMLRWVPDVDFTKLPAAKGEVVVVVDTSAGGDESSRALRTAAAEAILRALADEDKFALVALDVKPTTVYPDKGLASATEGDIAKALEKLAEHAVGGASDLGAMFEPSLERLHGAEQPAIVYVGDGIATSGEATPEALTDRLRRSLSGSRARLFTVAVGADARHEVLAQLARAGGGQPVRIDEAEQTTGEALRLASAIKTPTVTDLDVDLGAGLDQPFSSATGKLARGEELVLLARTHHALPDKVKIKGRVSAKDFEKEYPLSLEHGVATSLVPRLWASEYVRRLLGGAAVEESRSKVLDLGLEYGLLTPYTSILALDSESAYAQSGIKRRPTKLRGVRLTGLTSDREESELAALFAPFTPGAAGCSKRDAAPSAAAEASDTDNKEGGTGTRAKGEEGSMGNARQSRAASDAPVAPPAAAAPVAAPTSTSASDGRGDLSSFGGPSGGIGQAGALKVGGGGGTVAPGRAKGGLADVGASPKPTPPPATSPPPPREDEKKSLVAKDKADKERAKTLDTIAKPTPPLMLVKKPLGTCSDAASRPLAERVVLWKKRLKQAVTPQDLTRQYDVARQSCELPDWRDQAALLDLIQARVDTEEGADVVLSFLWTEPEARSFVARAILRRTVDPRLSSAVSRALFGGRIDWIKLDRELLDTAKPEDRLKKLREAMLGAPGDPSGDVRLVKLLAQTGNRAEARSHGRRLRDRGMNTPLLSLQLGDVLATAKEDEEEAKRTYSEIVEFDGESAASRRVLGDVFLRHAWYPEAYRQYKTLVDLDPRSQVSWLRLAASAAGSGRVDEAWRIERQVATGEGTPGPDDPRYWARLWSAARMGSLLEKPEAGTQDQIARRLKELALFSGPGTLALLTWEDLDARLSLVNADDKKEQLAGELTDAGATGLVAMLTSNETWQKNAWAARWKSAPQREVAFKVVVLDWNGKTFSVTVKRGVVRAEDRQAPLLPGGDANEAARAGGRPRESPHRVEDGDANLFFLLDAELAHLGHREERTELDRRHAEAHPVGADVEERGRDDRRVHRLHARRGDVRRRAETEPGRGSLRRGGDVGGRLGARGRLVFLVVARRVVRGRVEREDRRRDRERHPRGEEIERDFSVRALLGEVAADAAAACADDRADRVRPRRLNSGDRLDRDDAFGAEERTAGDALAGRRRRRIGARGGGCEQYGSGERPRDRGAEERAKRHSHLILPGNLTKDPQFSDMDPPSLRALRCWEGPSHSRGTCYERAMEADVAIDAALEGFGRDYLARFSAASTEQELRDAKATVLGKKGALTEILKQMGKVAPEERKRLGERVNALKAEAEAAFASRLAALAAALRDAELRARPYDLTLPGRVPTPRGHLHPLTQVTEDVLAIFADLGFRAVEGPEVELEENNFTKLGFPPDHPATDMQDTFWVKVDGAPEGARTLLRTHTSSVQIREMTSRPPPMAVVSAGAVFRRDDDMTHSPMFHQIEGFLIDRRVTFGDLKGVLGAFAERLYGKGTKTRFRPSYFPFVEPGAEVDASCVFCSGRGCARCKGTGWMEILGCGMIHPVVYEQCGLDPQAWSGFAFGIGMERVAMLRYGIPDLRLMFENDPRFLAQF